MRKSDTSGPRLSRSGFPVDRDHEGRVEEHGPAHPFGPPTPAWRRTLCGSLALGALGLGVFYWGFHGRFLLDDEFNIVTNLSMRQGRDWARLLWGDRTNLGVAGHPVLNLLYAGNYLLGGLSTTGYHAVNLAIHLLAAVVLWAVLGRTFALPTMPVRLRQNGRLCALLAVAVWLIHPLQTNTVTYISQRAESLVGLFYLLAFYGLLRRAVEPARIRWLLLSLSSLMLGMLVKETIATAPLLLVLFDRAYVAESWRQVWRKRGFFHVIMGGSWALLLNLDFHGRGYGASLGVDPWHYLLTEARVLGGYLGVMAWPPGMIFDYGDHFAKSLGEVWPWVLAVAAALAATGFLWRRDPRQGFVGAAFFLLLAPTSSFIPFPHMPYSESRLYLPLAVVVAAGVAAVGVGVGRRWTTVLVVLLLPLLAFGTIRREGQFVDGIALFHADLAKNPDNARNHCNLGQAYFNRGRTEAAEAEFRTAIRLAPDYMIAISNLGACLEREGRIDEAMADYRRARRLDPYYPYPRANLANLLVQRQEWTEAAEEYRQLLILAPGNADFACNLGYCYQQLNRWAEALTCYSLALTLDDQLNTARNDRGGIYVLLQRYPEAVADCEEAIRRQPGFADAYLNLGHAFGAEGRDQPALQAYAAALRLVPTSQIAIQAIQGLVIKMGAVPSLGPVPRPAKL
jgi:tetratricopeptide (TPR) repeat protein